MSFRPATSSGVSSETSLGFGIFGARGDATDVLVEADVLVEMEVVEPGELPNDDRRRA